LALAFETADELDALVPTIAEGLERFVLNPNAFGQANPAAYASFTAHAVAGQFADVFERAAQQHHSIG
jgi:hypothetical protein